METPSPKNRSTALLLCLFLGVFGAQRFYVGKFGTAILCLLTVGGFGIWVVADAIMICTGQFRDKQGMVLVNWYV